MDVLAPPRLLTQFAASPAEIRTSQKLRYRVFKEELNAAIADNEHGIDEDRFDAHCEHLLVRDASHDSRIAGSYRLLPGERAERVGGFYSETEFDLGDFAALRRQCLEIGRACVAPEYRGGTTLAMLWAGVLHYAMRRGYRYIIGCASVPAAVGQSSVAHLYDYLRYRHHADMYVRPLKPMPISVPRRFSPADISIPPLLLGYLRAGAQIGGPPAWDPAFGCADFFIVLPLARMDARYARRLTRNSHSLAAA